MRAPSGKHKTIPLPDQEEVSQRILPRSCQAYRQDEPSGKSPSNP